MANFVEQLLNYAHLHHLLPYESYDPKTKLFFNEGSTGFVLKGHPLVGASLSDQNQLAQFFSQSHALPEGCSLQFLLIAKPSIEAQMDWWLTARIPASTQSLERLAKNRSQFLKDKSKQLQGTVVRDFEVVISYTVPGHISDVLLQEELVSIREDLKNTLKLMGMPIQTLDADGLLLEVSSLWTTMRGEKCPSIRWNPHDSLKRQVSLGTSPITITESALLFDEGVQVRSYCSRSSSDDSTSPNYWALSHMDRFLGDLLEPRHQIPCPYWIHFGLFVENNQGIAKTKATAKRESLENALKGQLAKWWPGLREQWEESREIVEQLQLGGRVLITGLTMTTFATATTQRYVDQCLRIIWQDAGWSFYPARFDQLPVFLSCLPMMWTLGEKRSLRGKKAFGYATALHHVGKAKTTITKEAQNMLPLLGEWKGQDAPGMPLIGRRGQLFFWNPFSNALLPKEKNAQTDHNYNVCIAGQSGSGKSVFMNDLVQMVLGVGGKVFVLDFGRSFKKACQDFKGCHIEFDIRLPLSLNPFSKIPESADKGQDREEMLSTLRPIFRVMAAPRVGTTELQDSYLDEAIRQAWAKNGSTAQIDDVVTWLKAHKNKEAQDLGQMLFAFTSKGSYGHFFNPPATANFKENLVVIETDHLRNYPDLLAVVIQLLILQINQQMAQGDRVTPFLIVIDEAWKLLSGSSTGDFISEATRTARKYKGSIVLGTQHLTDYFKSSGAEAAWNCSAWKCILYQESDVILSLKNDPQLKYFVDTDFKENLLKSVHSNPPHYSEIAIFGPKVHGVIGRLCLDPFSRLLYSTNAAEYQAIETLINAGASIEEAVELVRQSQLESSQSAG